MRQLHVSALVAVVLLIPCVGWACETQHHLDVAVPQLDRLQETLDRVLDVGEPVATSAPAGGNSDDQVEPVEDLGLPGTMGLALTVVGSVALLVFGRRLPRWAVLVIRGVVVGMWAKARKQGNGRSKR